MAGTNVITQSPRTVRKLILDWLSDASGDVNGTKVEVSGEILRVTFKPDGGGTQPTALYDVTLDDDDGVDVLNGKGANLSNTATTTIAPMIGDGTTTDKIVAVDGRLELKVTNAGNAKGGIVSIYYR